MFFFSSRRRHTRSLCDWSSDVCSSDLIALPRPEPKEARQQIRSPELVKEKAKSWNQEISRKEFPRGLEWARITRREELKLVHRVFSPAGAERAPQVVLFSGVEDGHAASTISARCCEVLAEQGDGLVCAVDANLESPFLHRYFGVPNEKGMMEALCDSSPVNAFVLKTKDSNLCVMPTGAANTEFELSAREIAERLKERMNELRVFFKYVLIHSPVCSDRAARSEEHTSELQSHSDLVCRLLLEKKNTTREDEKS